MNWIVLNEKNNRIILTSKRVENSGILPNGSYITVDMSLTDQNDNRKFILRVEESEQTAIYTPSPLLADLNLNLSEADRECKNQIKAQRIFDISDREDGLVDYIKPQSLARLATKTEILKATDSILNNGPVVFPSTIHGTKCQKIRDYNNELVQIKIPTDFYWHQIQITGKTGSGKTVATKYLAQHFIENLITDENINRYGCVLAINVKDVDFLKMDQPSISHNIEVTNEWQSLNVQPTGIKNFEILYSAHEKIESLKGQGVTPEICRPITLNANKIEPESLLGIVENLTELAAGVLPDIFRYWQKNSKLMKYNDFLDSLDTCRDNDFTFNTLDITGRVNTTNINPSTFNAMYNRLLNANKYFEQANGTELDANDILQEGKMTVINVASSIDFGSIVLRYLLNKIIDEKEKNNIPILIIIDEVHQFYKSSASKNALGDLDIICRQGRSKKIGVIFSSQNINDIPSGLTSVINSKFMFKTDEINKKVNGISSDDIQSMKSGYCISNIHGLPQLKVAKFPLSKSGVL